MSDQLKEQAVESGTASKNGYLLYAEGIRRVDAINRVRTMVMKTQIVGTRFIASALLWQWEHKYSGCDFSFRTMYRHSERSDSIEAK